MAPLSKRKPVEPKLDDVVIKAGEGRIMSSADILHPPIEDEIGLGEHEKASREVVDAESDRRPALEVCDDGNSEHHATETQEVAPNGGREKDRSTLLNGGGKTHMAGRTDERSSSAPRQTPPRKSSKHYSSAYMTNARSNPRIPRKLDAEDIPSESSNIAHCFQLQPAQAQSDHVSSNRTNAVEARGEDTTHLKEIERLKRELTKKDTQIALKDAEIERKSELLDQLSKKIRDQKREIEDQESMTKAEVQRRNRQTIRIRQQASTMSEQDQRLRDLERQVQQLQEENVEKSKVNRDVNDAWRRATNELARLTQQSQVYKVDDTMLMGMYEGIIYSAGNWAANYCGGRGRTFFSQDELSPLMPLTMYYAQYASSEKLRPVLIQSLIVKKLAMTVLNYSDIEPVGCLWAGRLSPGLRQIQKGLEPGMYTPKE
ncbi:hypothetical protein BCR34DRAFT_322705 [Clohesyomyces aquaticus]|uniref:Uncharacterized protein n=1 Tax=Clohesyomyces aquaticus TaxID=1231657 RepID=A0A1Y2A830_9PLEO|nr:hypothetical protein BCR34DRAFT_322705 [Clohesyomyces aquaticus]